MIVLTQSCYLFGNTLIAIATLLDGVVFSINLKKELCWDLFCSIILLLIILDAIRFFCFGFYEIGINS